MASDGAFYGVTFVGGDLNGEVAKRLERARCASLSFSAFLRVRDPASRVFIESGAKRAHSKRFARFDDPALSVASD